MALSYTRSALALATFAAVVSLVTFGCSQFTTEKSTTTSPATGPAPLAGSTASKGGAQLWQETCSHCHNVRSPSAYSSAQWDVIMHDMHVRAHLTGEEHRKILEFLKASH